MKEVLTEIEHDILKEMYDNDVQQAKNKLLRYLMSTFLGVQFDYELISINDNVDSDKFVARLLITYPKGAVATQPFINFINDKHYAMAETEAVYTPRHVEQDSLPDMEMFAFDFDWSISAYRTLVDIKRKQQIMGDFKSENRKK